jgi:sulfite exporter TauE/SafE
MTDLLFATMLAAAIAGIAGSTHCLAMCGGIAGALGLSSRAAAQRSGRALSYPLVYNLGRITSYTLAGALVGGIGAGMGELAGAASARLPLQFAAGAVLVLLGLRLVAGKRGFAWLDAAGAVAWRRISPLLRHVLPIDSLPRALGAGMLWGWLPCGMAYGLLGVAWLSTGALDGALIMLAFGLGTLPALLAVGSAASRIGSLAGHPAWRGGAGLLIAATGALTLAAPWVMPDGGHGSHWLDALVAACLPGRTAG